MFNAISPEMQTRMPHYTGDLELTNFSTGSLTSQAYHKRWIIKNENLADAAEKASVAAEWMGGRPYPQQRLNDAWMLELGGHFHDTASGTATPQAYEFAWNDDLIAANQFGTVLTSATESLASAFNTEAKGTPIVVYNPLNIERQDLVEAKVSSAGGAPKAVRVTGPDGKQVPAQMEEDGMALFLAKAPSVGYAVYDVQAAGSETPNPELKVTDSTLENARYLVKLDANGDVSSIFDKSLNKELLSAPMRLAISHDTPTIYPAWYMYFDQEQAAPRTYVSGPAKIRIRDKGPVRVSIEVSREAEGSKFVQTISLAAGDAGNQVEFANAIDWRTLDANLKETFAFTASNTDATYNWDVGTIQRPNAYDRSCEVASHRWIDLTDKSGSYGATILTDCKNGSDKLNDNTIRLTLMRSPGIAPVGNPLGYTDQANQDWGHHEFVFGLAGHAGDWREAQTDWKGFRLNDPLIAFETSKHAGSLGKTFSLLHLNDPRIRVLALKKAEADDEVILRMVELDGKSHPDVRVTFAGPVTAAREVNAQEQPLGDATVTDGSLATSFTAYQPRTFALKLGAAPATLAALHSEPVKLNYDLAVASSDDTKTGGGGIDGKGDAIPAAMLPEQLHYNGAQFDLAPAETGKPNAVVAKGQIIELPKDKFNRIYILAASSEGDQAATFRAGSASDELNIQDWTGFIGEWDTRMWKTHDDRNFATSANPTWPPADLREREMHLPSPRYPQDYVGLMAGYVKQASLGWYASHHHTPEGLNQPYQYSYLFAYTMNVPGGAHSLTLPNNDKIRILAVSVGEDSPELKPAAPLFDTLGSSEPPQKMEETASR
jgi:alpha-mannosidase